MTAALTTLPQLLHCRFGRATADAADAWLLPGREAAAWLEEILRWQVPLAGVRLTPLPTSARDATVSGVLVMPGSPPRGAPGPRALPYRAIGPTLFVPCGAALWPPAGDAELRARVVWPIAVLHPGLGLIGCRADDLVSAIDLLEVGLPQPQAWAQAVAAAAPRRGLSSVLPAEYPTAENVLSELRGDIGRTAPDALPRLPQESPGRRWIDRVKLRLADAAGGLAGAAGQGSALGKLGQWAREQAASLTAGLEAARAQELARLLHLLDSDPDEGLRYALPLTGDGASRGIAPPGRRLTKRDPTFKNAPRSGGADAWDVRAEVQQRLRERYRALAARELGLGRFRRAAYVFASLLGDFIAAANALEQGQCWREAATLYQEKLSNRSRAAACLEKGGLFHEAIAIYLTLGQHEKIGDLYGQIARPTEAATAYRAAVDASLLRDDVLSAARLLETKLTDPDAALAALTDGWPASKQAAACLREAYALLARTGRHDEARRRIDAVRGDARRHAEDAAHVVALADVLANTAVDYPADAARDAANDAVRLLAGHAMASGNSTLTDAMLAAVNRASGGDALLARDTARFRSEQSVAAAAPRTQSVRVLRTFLLGMSGPCTTWANTGDGFIAMTPSPTNAHLQIVRGSWDGRTQVMAVELLQGGPLFWRILAGRRQVRLFSIGFASDFESVTLPAAFGRPALEVSSGSRLADGVTLGVALTGDGRTVWLGGPADAPPRAFVHSVYGVDALLNTADADLTLPDTALAGSLHFDAQGDLSLLAAGRSLFLFRGGRVVRTIGLPGEAVSMSGDTAAVQPPRLAVGFDDGAALVWPTDGAIERFAADLVRPVTQLVQSSVVVAVDATHGRIYDIADRRPKLRAVFTPDADVVGVTSLYHDDQFATLSRDGRVTVYAFG